MSTSALEALGSVDFNWATLLESVWEEPPSHGEVHNVATLNLLLQDMKKLSMSAHGGSLLGRIILGEGGSGKTFLARLLHARVVAKEMQFVFVDCTDVNEFWATILHSYLKSLQHHPYKGKTQLQSLLWHLWQPFLGGEYSEDMFQEMAHAKASKFLEDTDQLITLMGPLLQKAKQALGSPIVVQIIRALYLLISTDERLNDLGTTWFLGPGLEKEEADQLKLSNSLGTVYSHAAIVKGLSWLMAQRAPTLLVMDQLDPIVQQNHLSAAATTQISDEQLKARAIIEGLGGGLSKLYDNTYRTLSVVLALPKTWEILQSTTLQSNLERFHAPSTLKPVDSLEAVKALLLCRLEPAYASARFTPLYPTYPFTEAGLRKLAQQQSQPRPLLKEFSQHQEKCLLEGKINEYQGDQQSVKAPPVIHDFAKALEERVAKADIARLLDHENEDELGDRLAALCQGLVYECGDQPDITFTYENDFKGGSYPSLHARVRRIEHAAGEREEHYCLRALFKKHHNAFSSRLSKALTEAGIDQALPFRRLILIRNEQGIPNGETVKKVYQKFIKAGGKTFPIQEDELKTIEAIRGLLNEKPPGFTQWLAKVRPLCKLPVVKKAFGDLIPPETPSPVESQPESALKASALPAQALKSSPGVKEVAPAPSAPVLVTISPAPAARQVNVTPASTFPLGRRLIGGAAADEVTLSLGALSKHIVIRAGSGGGKTVLVKRLIEEAALSGIPSIVLDPGNDLSWLGDPWPSQPEGWQPADSKKAEDYLDNTEVVIWTPGKSLGRPLNLPGLPDFRAVAEDKDSLNEAVEMAQASLAPLCAPGKSKSADLKQGVLMAALRAFAQVGGGLTAFIEFLSDIPPEATGGITNGIKMAAEIADSLRAAVLKNPLMEEGGQLLDIGVLFGIGRPKTRISVINLSGLHSLESQQQFVNQLAMALFTWIKKNPSLGPARISGLFVIDEAKDFLPGGNTNPCKKSLMRLAAQARKYGLGMVLATQNPKDLDYNAVAQFATQFFGRANAPQVIEFIDELLTAKGGNSDGVGRLQRGQFYVTSSEGIGHPVKIKVPICLSNHPDGKPMTESEIIARSQGPV